MDLIFSNKTNNTVTIFGSDNKYNRGYIFGLLPKLYQILEKIQKSHTSLVHLTEEERLEWIQEILVYIKNNFQPEIKYITTLDPNTSDSYSDYEIPNYFYSISYVMQKDKFTISLDIRDNFLDYSKLSDKGYVASVVYYLATDLNDLPGTLYEENEYQLALPWILKIRPFSYINISTNDFIKYAYNKINVFKVSSDEDTTNYGKYILALFIFLIITVLLISIGTMGVIILNSKRYSVKKKMNNYKYNKD